MQVLRLLGGLGIKRNIAMLLATDAVLLRFAPINIKYKSFTLICQRNFMNSTC
jgi:hypothetical protein